MKKAKFGTLLMLGVALVASNVIAEEILVDTDKNVNMEISIYNNNLAFVKDTRSVNLVSGNNLVAFEGVARDMRPDTVNITAEGINVVEQNYDYNLMNYMNILKEYIGKDVKTAIFNQQTGQTIYDTATVIDSNYGSPVLQFKYGIESQFPGRIIFEKMPDNLRNKPTLVASIDNEIAGNKNIEMAYLTNNVSWKANYIADVVGEDILNLKAWVTLNNNSGTDYKDVTVNLISGSVNKAYDDVQPVPPMARNKMMMMAEFGEADMAAGAPDFGGASREAVADYYLYNLPQKTTIKDKQSKQVSLLSKDAVKFEKTYRLQSPIYSHLNARGGDFKKANPDVIFNFNNVKADNLGEPLPQGTVRFYEKDSKGAAQFLGEANLNQLAVSEKAELALGKSFDVFVRGKSTSSKRIAENVSETDFEIVFNNSKDKAVKVEFLQMFSNDWEVVSESVKSERENSSTAKWVVDVAPAGETKLIFKVRLTRK